MPATSESGKADTNQNEEIYLFAKQMLQSRLFIGNFQEKRYVEALKAYRDVIVLSHEETDLIRDLEVVKKRLRGYYGSNYWIGITGPDMIGAPAGFCIWVELQDEIFGNYWYKISKIRIRANEIVLRLKVIRPISDNNTSFECSSSMKRDLNSSKPATNNSNEEDVLSFIKINESMAVLKNLRSHFTSIFTAKNTFETVRFTFVLLVALMAGLVRLLEYLGDFTLKLVHELSLFIKALTPILVTCINLIGKIIGGFYLLILGMWRDRRPVPAVDYRSANRNSRLQIMDGNNEMMRSVPVQISNGKFQQRVMITPLE